MQSQQNLNMHVSLNTNLSSTNENSQIIHKNKSRNNYQPIWTKLRQIKKCQMCRQEGANLQNIVKQNIKTKILGSNNRYFINTIDKIVFKKRLHLNVGHIWLRDSQFNETAQFLNRYNKKQQSIIQLTELFQYYKYYRQYPLCFKSQFFTLLFQYQERKKIIQYNRLKLLLILDPTQEEINGCEIKRDKSFSDNNILDFIDDQDSNMIYLRSKSKKQNQSQQKSLLADQQSILLVQLRDKLCKYSKPISGKKKNNKKKNTNQSHKKDTNRLNLKKNLKKNQINLTKQGNSLSCFRLSNQKNAKKSSPDLKKLKINQKSNKLSKQKNKSNGFVKLNSHFQSTHTFQTKLSSKKSHNITKSQFTHQKQYSKPIISHASRKDTHCKQKNHHKSMDFDDYSPVNQQKNNKQVKKQNKQVKKQKSQKSLKLDNNSLIINSQKQLVEKDKIKIHDTINFTKIKIKKQKEKLFQNFCMGSEKHDDYLNKKSEKNKF